MALTPEQIDRLIQQADGLAPKEGSIFRALVKLTEAEVRKNYDALIRQMLDALTAPVDGDALHALHMSAIAAARAHLLDSDLSKLTERGAKAWAGVDPQKLREGGAL